MPQQKAMLCIGIDKFSDGINPLFGAAQDARALGSVFQLLLGFRVEVLTHDELKQGADIFERAHHLLQGLGPGDVFGLFLASHGKEQQDHRGASDRVFVLPNAQRSSLFGAHFAAAGLLSLSQLAEDTARQGVDRFFIFDACRSPILQSAGADRDGEASFAYTGEAVDREMARRSMPAQGALQSPLVILNACSNLQKAKELPKLKRGLFSLSAEEVFRQRHQTSQPLEIGADLVNDIALAMQRNGQHHQIDTQGQRPHLEGKPLMIWQQETTGLSAAEKERDERLWRYAVACVKAQGIGAYKEYLKEAPIGAAHVDEAYLCIEQLQDAQTAARWAGPPPPPPPPQPIKLELKRRVVKKPGQVFRDAPWSPEMVVIPAGRFLMGSPEDEEGHASDEGPQHEVVIARPFAMGRCTVTFEEYDLFAKEEKQRLPNDRGWGRGKRPVFDLRWNDAQAYLVWLNRKLSLSAPGPHYRLPTEVEWEYAARAGTSTPFWWGSEIDSGRANYRGNYVDGNGKKGEYRKQTVPADAFEANPWGLYNVHGNVWEWAQGDSSDYYRFARGEGSERKPGVDEARRVLRGGSWNSNPGELRAASRDWFAPDFRRVNAGFRIARTL